MEYLDLKGTTCPVPVIETKRLLETRDVSEAEIIVDNTASSENVGRFLESQGFSVVTEAKGDLFVLRAERWSRPGQPDLSKKTRLLVFVDGETMGRGSDELGMILMRSFLNTLKDLDPRPWRLIFANAGVKLAAEGSEYLHILKELEALDVEILSCGTCLDYFHLKEKVGAGRISNMFEILSSFAAASALIKP
jgi:selenium metabolism protein YedF